MSFKKKFGTRINNLRKVKGISQEELAFRAKLDRTYISDIENGSRNISLVVIKKLTKGLEINITEIVKDL